MSPNAKSSRMLLSKFYFDPLFKVKTESLWDTLPQECKEIVRDFEREHLMARRIQQHWRQVRYSPGTAPKFAAKQRVLMFWGSPQEETETNFYQWATGDVGRKNTGYYEAKIYPDNWSKTVYYYDQAKREARHTDWALRGFFGVGGENCARNYHEPKCVSIIKPW